jgi:hypothetical protein
MKSILVPALLISVASPDLAYAQMAPSEPAAKRRISGKRPADVKGNIGGGVEAIQAHESPSKDLVNGNSWNGAYVGVNAGAGFGTTTGSSVVLPIGSSGQKEK